MKRKKIARNVARVDGLPWVLRGGQLWGDYDVCSEYTGIARSSFPVFVWRHSIKTIKHGRKTLASKDDIDRKTGVVSDDTKPTKEYLPIRGRKRLKDLNK